MHACLQPYFQQLERQRLEFSAWVAKAPAQRQHQSPGAGQWSAAQVLFHLAFVDAQVQAAMVKRLGNGKPLRPLTWSTRVRAALLNLFLRLPLKFKAPAAVREVPAQVGVPEVIRDWEKTRQELQAFLSSFPADHLDKELFFHPRSGMITLPQTLRFMVEHTEHHRRQMQRLLS